MKKTLILITGLPGSGKSAAADIIAKRYGAKIYHTGDIIREEVKRRKLPYTPASDKKVAKWFHTGGREKVLAERAWEKVRRTRKKIIILEGFRNVDNVRHIEDVSGLDPVIIEVKVPFRIRAKRELERGRFKKGENMAYLRRRDEQEKKRGLGYLLKLDHYEIDNSGTLKDLEKNIDKLMKRILKR